MTIYLYKKTHNQTGLKYLGKTKKSDPHKYQGSGKRWVPHIKKHGYDVTTEILRECKTNEEVKYWGKYYSNLWNVVDSLEWANLCEETGEGTGGKVGVPRSEKTRQKIRENKPDQSGSKNGMFGKSHTQESRKKCGLSNKGKDIKTIQGKESIRQNLKRQWNDPQYREKMISSMKSRKGEKRSEDAIESYKLSAKRRIEKMTPEQRSEISKKAAETRKKKYFGLKRKRTVDENGKVSYVYLSIDDTTQN